MELNIFVGVENGIFLDKVFDVLYIIVSYVDGDIVERFGVVCGMGSFDIFNFLGDEFGYVVFEGLGVGGRGGSEGFCEGGM